jgi:hypothetical protein
MTSDPHGHRRPIEDEPQTPMWLPALGAALFIAFGVWLAVRSPSAAEQPQTRPSASPAAPAAGGTAAGDVHK